MLTSCKNFNVKSHHHKETIEHLSAFINLHQNNNNTDNNKTLCD